MTPMLAAEIKEAAAVQWLSAMREVGKLPRMTPKIAEVLKETFLAGFQSGASWGGTRAVERLQEEFFKRMH